MVQQPIKVLVVDDDQVIRQFLTTGLRYEGFDVVDAEDGAAALTLAARFQPDMVVLDLMMPGVDGYQVCQRLRGRPGLGILMLTAKDEVGDRVKGLDLGADDYLVKPFHFDELLSRMRAVLRRLGRNPSQILSLGPIVLDEARHQVGVGGLEVELTAREYDLLRLLLQHPHQVLARQMLLDRVWGPDFFGGENNVDVCISRLRSKLGEPGRQMIQTVRGVGFRIAL